MDDQNNFLTPHFDAKDISIQQVAMDTNGIKGKKEWVAVVNLNTKSDDGYLQSEEEINYENTD